MTCRKIKYRSQEQAIVANSRTTRRYGEMEPYWHEPCRAWHLGHEIGSWAIDQWCEQDAAAIKAMMAEEEPAA